jgi:hypothetical protein
LERVKERRPTSVPVLGDSMTERLTAQDLEDVLQAAAAAVEAAL